jgi:phosphoglycerate dehydrogenase-like enzyme
VTPEPSIEDVAIVGTFPFERIGRIGALFAPARVTARDWNAPDVAAILARSDVAVLSRDLDERVLASPRLRWVHCEHAGLEASARTEVFERGLRVTGAAGRSAVALAQHAFYFALALSFDVRSRVHEQEEVRWNPGFGDHAVALAGRRLGVVGFGHTGREMVRLGRAFDMEVQVANRSGTADSGLRAVRFVSTADRDGFGRMIRDSDVLMLACSLNDQTFHLLDDEALRSMRSNALLINMARGAVVDERALVDVLTEGRIAGAGLDVFEVEPLPSDSPLWKLPNVLITPHTTPRLIDRDERAFQILTENVARYRAGRPLLNELMPADLYSARSARAGA